MSARAHRKPPLLLLHCTISLLSPHTHAGEHLWCRGHPDTKAYYCRAHSLLVRPSAVVMSAGGEELGKVMGRTEEEELPQVTSGG